MSPCPTPSRHPDARRRIGSPTPLAAAAALLLLLATTTAAPAQLPTQTLVKIADGFVAPLAVTSLDPQRLLVVDQIGLIHVLEPGGARRPDPFLDLRPKLAKLNQGFDERGLLGLALHPKFAENGRLFVYYSAQRRASCPTNWDHTSHVSEFTATPDRARVDPASERLLLQIDQPYFNHNGGRLAFGPDGLLYLGVGDGGNANDQGFDRAPTGNAQDLTTLLGKILRLDVDRRADDLPYAIPADNPFVGKSGARPEIYAWGLRNPWGLAFDRGGTRQLVAADVGQGRYEEINVVRRGGNYGWNQREGRHAFDPANPMKPGAERAMQAADRESFLDPVLEYKNLNGFPQDPDALGISVTGGFVYRGQDLPHLQGRYVFADWSRQWAVPDGRLFGARPTPDGSPWIPEPLPVLSHPGLKLGAYVVAFGEDAAGELYVLTTQRAGLVERTGTVWKLAPARPAAP